MEGNMDESKYGAPRTGSTVIEIEPGKPDKKYTVTAKTDDTGKQSAKQTGKKAGKPQTKPITKTT
jgi:hypothetical protein